MRGGPGGETTVATGRPRQKPGGRKDLSVQETGGQNAAGVGVQEEGLGGAEGRVSSIRVWPPYSLHLLEAGAGEAGLWRGWAVKGPAGWSGAGPKASAGESNPCAARGTCFTSLCFRGLYHSGSFRKTKTALGVSTRGSVGELAKMSVRDGRSEASNRSCRGAQPS